MQYPVFMQVLQTQQYLSKHVHDVILSEGHFGIVYQFAQIAHETLHSQVDVFFLDEDVLKLDDVRMIDRLKYLDLSNRCEIDAADVLG